MKSRPGKRLKISTDYTGLGKIQYLLAEQGVTIMDTEYAEGVELDAAVPLEQCLELEKKLTDSTSGKAKLMWEETIEFADLNGTIKVFLMTCKNFLQKIEKKSKKCLTNGMFSCRIPIVDTTKGYRQTVRQRTLTPSFQGSILVALLMKTPQQRGVFFTLQELAFPVK